MGGGLCLEDLKMTDLNGQTGRESVDNKSMNVTVNDKQQAAAKEQTWSSNPCLNKLQNKILLYWLKCLKIRHGSAHYDIFIPFMKHSTALFTKRRGSLSRLLNCFGVRRRLALICIKRRIVGPLHNMGRLAQSRGRSSAKWMAAVNVR